MMNFGDTNRRRGNGGGARNYKPNRYAAREMYEKRRMEEEIHQWSHDESKNNHGSRYQDKSRRYTNYDGGNEFDHNDTTRKPYKSRTRYDGYESRDAYDENEYNFSNKNRSDWNAHRCYDVENRDNYRASERNHNPNRSVYAGDQRQSGTDTRGSYRTPEKKDAGENRGAYGYKGQFRDKQCNEKYYRKASHARIENYSSEINTKSANHGQYDTNARRSTYDEYGDSTGREPHCRCYGSNQHNRRHFYNVDNPERSETFGGEKQDIRSNYGYHTSKSHHGVGKETKYTESRNLTFCDTERVVSRNGSWNERKHVDYGDPNRRGGYGGENRCEGVSLSPLRIEFDRQKDVAYGFPASRTSITCVKSLAADDSVIVVKESYMTYDEYRQKEMMEQRNSGLQIYVKRTPKSSTNFLCQICNIRTTSQVQMDSHINGGWHQRRLKYTSMIHKYDFKVREQFQEALTNIALAQGDIQFQNYVHPAGQFFCELCQVKLNDQNIVKQHIFGRKHLKRACDANRATN